MGKRESKARRVRELLLDPMSSGRSDRSLAAELGVSPPTVARHRRLLRPLLPVEQPPDRTAVPAEPPGGWKPTVRPPQSIGNPMHSAPSEGTVYVLMDGPRPFYVGATTQSLPSRLAGHVSDAVERGNRSWASQLIRDMAACQPPRQPAIEVWEAHVPVEMLGDRETLTIRRMWEEGYPILNAHDGGYDCSMPNGMGPLGTSKADYLRSITPVVRTRPVQHHELPMSLDALDAMLAAIGTQVSSLRSMITGSHGA